LTDAEGEAVRDVELAALYATHERLLEMLSDQDRWCCRVLAGLEGLSLDSIPIVKKYALRLITSNAEKELYDQFELDQHLSRRLLHLEHERATMRGDKYKRKLETLRRQYESET
jgi:hypothetical protein